MAAAAPIGVPRGTLPRGLGPGVFVYVKARHWGEAYAKTRFGSAWTTRRVKGQIESAVEGKGKTAT